MLNGGPPTVMTNWAEAIWIGVLRSVTAAVKVATPFVVGVPEIVPVDASVNPAGRLPDAIAHL
jgi:hypothetical protein